MPSKKKQKADQGQRARQPPAFITPMAAVVVRKLPEGDEWIYEVKFDGYRALIIKDKQQVELRSRKNKDSPGCIEETRRRACGAISTVQAVLDRQGLVTRRRRRRHRASGTALANAHALARVPPLAWDQHYAAY
jgi:hypothetical protein